MSNGEGTQPLNDFQKCKFEFQINHCNFSNIFWKFSNNEEALYGTDFHRPSSQLLNGLSLIRLG
jgi:hypothetical protein